MSEEIAFNPENPQQVAEAIYLEMEHGPSATAKVIVEQLTALKAENERIHAEDLRILNQNATLQDKCAALEAENELLKKENGILLSDIQSSQARIAEMEKLCDYLKHIATCNGDPKFCPRCTWEKMKEGK